MGLPSDTTNIEAEKQRYTSFSHLTPGYDLDTLTWTGLRVENPGGKRNDVHYAKLTQNLRYSDVNAVIVSYLFDYVTSLTLMEASF